MKRMHDDLAGSSPSRDASTRAAGAQEPDSAEPGQQSLPEEEQEIVRRRAYEIYLARDGAAGDEAEDWLTAEREIRGGRAQKDAAESQREPREDQR